MRVYHDRYIQRNVQKLMGLYILTTQISKWNFNNCYNHIKYEELINTCNKFCAESLQRKW